MAKKEELKKLIMGINSLALKYENLGFSVSDEESDNKREWILSKDDDIEMKIKVSIVGVDILDKVNTDNSPLSAYHVMQTIKTDLEIKANEDNHLVKELLYDFSHYTETEITEENLVYGNQ